MQRLAQQPRNSYPTRDTNRRTLGPWWPSLLFLLLLLPVSPSAAEDSTRVGFTAGIVSTNWHIMSSAGIVYQKSAHWANFAFADIGGGLASFQIQPALLFRIDSHWSLCFFTGPELTVYQEAPTLEQKLTYLSAATGVGAWIKLPPRVGLLISAESIASQAPISRYRLGLRLVLWVT